MGSMIRLNGEERPWPEAMTVAQLLEQLEIDTRMVAVEHNRSVVKRAQYAATTINEGDEVEIVSFVGGG